MLIDNDEDRVIVRTAVPVVRYRQDESRKVDSGSSSLIRFGASFINETILTIYIKDSTGMVAPIPPSMLGPVTKNFIMRKRVTLTYDAMICARNSLLERDFPYEIESTSSVLYDALNESDFYGSGNVATRDYPVDTIIDTTDFTPYSVHYYPSIGLMVSFDETAITRAIHPAIEQLSPTISIPNSPEITSVFAEIVDNEGKMSCRYVNILGTVIPIVPITDFGRASGFYVRYRMRGEEIKWSKPLEEECENFGFFQTPEEAENYGDVEFAKQRLKFKESSNNLTLTELQALLKENEAKQKERELEAAQEKLERERFIQERDAFFSTRKLQLEAQSDSISHTNKTNLEYLKIIPAVATFAVLMYAIVNGKGKS